LIVYYGDCLDTCAEREKAATFEGAARKFRRL
jgi:hypothetical protein